MTALVALRQAQPEDREFLLGVYASTRADEFAHVPWDDAQRISFLREQAITQDSEYRRTYDDAQFFVVESDGDGIGRLYLHDGPGRLLLVDIALLPEWRGQGIGSRLIRDILAQADSRGLPVVLSVERSNPARMLYLRLGFVVTCGDGMYLEMQWQPVAS